MFGNAGTGTMWDMSNSHASGVRSGKVMERGPPSPTKPPGTHAGDSRIYPVAESVSLAANVGRNLQSNRWVVAKRSSATTKLTFVSMGSP